MFFKTISGVTKAISRARSSTSAFKAAKSAQVPADMTVRSGLCPRSTGGSATCSAVPASRMMVLNIAFHGDWLRLTEGDDDRHLDGRARDLNEIFLTPRRHVAPCCEGEIRNIAKQKSRE